MLDLVGLVGLPQALDLAGNTGEEDPCEEARLAISVGVPWFKLTQRPRGREGMRNSV